METPVISTYHLGSMSESQKTSMDFRINVRPSSIKMSPKYAGIRWDENIENRKSSIRCKVEHPFLIVKQQFGYCKTIYKGLAKNMNRFNILFACANLLMCIRAGRTKQFCTAQCALFQGSSIKMDDFEGVNPLYRMTFWWMAAINFKNHPGI